MKSESSTPKWGAFPVLLVCLVLTEPAAAQQTPKQVTVTRKPIPVATIKDRETIQFFVDQYFITEERIDSMEVIDILGDGFNEKDVLEIYPSKQLINLSESDTALAVMRNWQRSGYIEVVGSKNKKGEYEFRSTYPAAVAMSVGLVRLVEKTYVGQKLNLLFDFDDVEGTAGLQIWGYKEEELLKPKNPAEQFAHDLFYYVRTDTVYVPKPVYDVIYIEQTVTDTVYVKGGP
jgi:hypothetical protein